jgi:NAD+ synthase (glutamine-hydrolysing)
MQHIWNEIVEKLRKFVHDAGFKQVVIGGSGGIDSSVVICLATAALGKDNVMVAMMPSPYSSKGSVDDTVLLCANWGITTVVSLPITRLMVGFGDSLSNMKEMLSSFSTFQRGTNTFTEENIQARIRSVLLMAISNEYDCLVLNTCNRSEDYTGYCTLYGDSIGAIAPIGDLYKTEVYELARWINNNPDLPDIPEAVLTKAPTAELSEGQLDTDSLPPYGELDPILKMYLDEETNESYAKRGYDVALVKQIVKLVEGSAYKRAQSAPVLKLERKGL